jgi:hypothetical protein
VVTKHRSRLCSLTGISLGEAPDSLKSRARSPVGKPLAIVSNRKILLAFLANWLGRRSEMVTDDFVDRLAGWAEKQKIVHCHSLSAYSGRRTS